MRVLQTNGQGEQGDSDESNSQRYDPDHPYEKVGVKFQGDMLGFFWSAIAFR